MFYGTYPTDTNIDATLEVLRRVEIATRIMMAATLDEINTGRHHVVTADIDIRRWMCKATLFHLTIAFAAQKLTTHLRHVSISACFNKCPVDCCCSASGHGTSAGGVGTCTDTRLRGRSARELEK